jgi:hypothetical protein
VSVFMSNSCDLAGSDQPQWQWEKPPVPKPRLY